MTRRVARTLQGLYPVQPVVAVLGSQAGAGGSATRHRAASRSVVTFESAVYFLQQGGEVLFHSGGPETVDGVATRLRQHAPGCLRSHIVGTMALQINGAQAITLFLVENDAGSRDCSRRETHWP